MFQLAPKPGNIDSQCIFFNIVVRLPQFCYQRIPAHKPPFIFHQSLQNPELIFCQTYLLSVIGQRCVIQIQNRAPVLQHRNFSRQIICASQHSLHFGRQHA